MKRKENFKVFRETSVGARRWRENSYSPRSSLPEKSSREERVAFVMVNAESLSYESIVNGLLSGNFYPYTGPIISELYVEDGKVYIKCSDAKRISYSTRGRRTEAINATEGEYVKEACFEIREADEYFRIDVLDGEGNRANTQAYYIDEL